ncbi:17512_t:CDS:1, partial [Gigaspora rosea]
MLTPPNINKIFDIDEIKKINTDIEDNDADNMFDSILDATDGTGHVWETAEDDNM